MNDDHTPDLWLLAGAYLDGDLTAAERTRAEADPSVMEVVAQLRSLQSDLRATPPVSAVRREATIAAALDEFDTLQAARVVRPIAAGRRSHSRHARSNRWLGAVAAAVVVIGGLGVVVSSGLGGGGDDDSDALEGAAPAPADQATDGFDDAGGDARVADEEMASADEAAPAAPLLTEAGSTSDSATSATQAPSGEMTTSAEASSVADVAAAPETSAAAAAYQFAEDQPIADPDQLGVAATQLLEQERAGQLPNTPETKCGGDGERLLRVLAEGLYGTADTQVRQVLVAVDETTDEAFALDRDDCSTVAVAPLP